MVRGPTDRAEETGTKPMSTPAQRPVPLLTLMLEERWAVATLLGITAFLLLAGLLCIAAEFGPASVGRDLFIGLFNLRGESNVPTAFSVLLLAALILGVITGFRRQIRSADGFSWKALTVIFGGLTLEEATGLHGRTISMIREATGVDGALPYVWIMADGIVILIVLFAVLHFLDHLPATVRWRLTVGSVVYVCGALGVEMFGGMGMTPLAGDSLFSHLVHVAEESMEMVGAIVFIGGLLRFIRLYLPELKLRISFDPQRSQ